MTTSEKILNEARKYLGVQQWSPEHNSIVNVYNSVLPLPYDYQVTYNDDWCDIFISFLAIKTGSTDLIGRECGVDRHIQIFKSLGIWIEDGSITPKPGDIITFHWGINSQPNDGFADHIGIVESVSNGTITTIEGNSNRTVRRCNYNIGNGYIRGYARPSYGSSSNYSPYNGGPLINAGRTMSQDNIRLTIQYAKEYNLKPSFLITQMFIETHWGDPNTSTTGSVDTNWTGISEPFNPPAELNINMKTGTPRPSNEGGNYVYFKTFTDYIKAYTFVLSNRNGLYNVEGVTTIEDFCKGLFRSGGANADFATSGYQHYLNMLVPTYNALKEQNPGKLEMIDSSTVINDGTESYNYGTNESFTRISEIGTFYPNTTINVRDYPSTQGNILAQYTTGESFTYDSYVINDGYIWLSYIASSGARRYVAWRVQNGETFGTIPSDESGSSTTSSETNEGFTPISETGTFYPNTTINVRDYPSTAGNVVAQYTIGESVTYDSYVINDGYVWLSYIASSGLRRYVAWRVQGGETFGTIPLDESGNGTDISGMNEGFTVVSETGTFYPSDTVNVRDYPSMQGNILAQYTTGESVIYDSYVVNDGYVWVSYLTSSGLRRYVAWRVQGGETFGTIPSGESENGTTPSGTNEDFTTVSETGTFYPNDTVNVRDYPSTQGNILAQYTAGESVNYDSYVVNDGYVWVSYLTSSGLRRYVAWRVQGGETFGTIV